MKVAIGQDKSNGLVTFNQVEVLFFNFFFPPCQNVTTLEFRLLLLKKFRRSQGDKCPPLPPSGSANGHHVWVSICHLAYIKATICSFKYKIYFRPFTTTLKFCALARCHCFNCLPLIKDKLCYLIYTNFFTTNFIKVDKKIFTSIELLNWY